MRKKHFLNSCSRSLHVYNLLEIISQRPNYGVKLVIVFDELNWKPNIRIHERKLNIESHMQEKERERLGSRRRGYDRGYKTITWSDSRGTETLGNV